QALERGSRVPSRSRVPAGSVRQPGSGRVEDRVDRGVRNDRFGSRSEYAPGDRFDAGYDSGYGFGDHRSFGSGFGDSGRISRPGWIEERRSAELSFSVGSDRLRMSYGTPQPRPLPVPVPVHEVGELVHCRVPLATCVRVRGADTICGHFVPAVVAVRDPALCEHDADRLVYVQILVPPVPPRNVEVSRCHTRVELCFGELDVEIVSKNGMISVEYDD
ncbi:MAG: hypothetical protein ACKO2P_08905, partial [Planctomycetota bacterium]